MCKVVFLIIEGGPGRNGATPSWSEPEESYSMSPWLFLYVCFSRMKFSINLSSTVKKLVGIFIGIAFDIYKLSK